MSAKEQLLKEIAQSPDALIEEVLDFLVFIKSRHYQSLSGTNANPNGAANYEKISRVQGLLCDRKESLLTYANQVRQEWE